MSLIVSIGLNTLEPTVGFITIRRVEGSADPDSINVYDYKISTPASGSDPSRELDPTFEIIQTGEVKHRYGDGAFELLRSVLDDAGLSIAPG